MLYSVLYEIIFTVAINEQWTQLLWMMYLVLRAELYPADKALCTSFYRHKGIWLSPKVLDAHGIPYDRVVNYVTISSVVRLRLVYEGRCESSEPARINILMRLTVRALKSYNGLYEYLV